MQINPLDLISPSDAGRLIGVTRQTIDYLMNRRILQPYPIAGKRLVLKQDAIKYKDIREKRRE